MNLHNRNLNRTQVWEVKVLDLPPFSFTEAAEDDGDDDDGEGDVLQEEDEGRDSGGYYEDEEAEGEPYESQPTSDSGHSMPDFTADVDIHKSDVMPEDNTKPVQEPDERVENKPGDYSPFFN